MEFSGGTSLFVGAQVFPGLLLAMEGELVRYKVGLGILGVLVPVVLAFRGVCKVYSVAFWKDWVGVGIGFVGGLLSVTIYFTFILAFTNYGSSGGGAGSRISLRCCTRLKRVPRLRCGLNSGMTRVGGGLSTRCRRFLTGSPTGDRRRVSSRSARSGCCGISRGSSCAVVSRNGGTCCCGANGRGSNISTVVACNGTFNVRVNAFVCSLGGGVPDVSFSRARIGRGSLFCTSCVVSNATLATRFSSIAIRFIFRSNDLCYATVCHATV